MPQPEGNLTPIQYEIMEIVESQGSNGATVTEIWQVISARRSVRRTTILNLVDRLEKRGWLIRPKNQRPAHYIAALDREKTTALLAKDFVDDFFGGSASELVMSLLGSKRLKPEEIQQLQRELESAEKKCGRRRGK